MTIPTGVPAGVRKPGFFGKFNTALAQGALPSGTKKVLLAGIRTTGSGSADPNKPYQITDSKMGETLFGAGSNIDQMIKAAMATYPYLDLWAAGVGESAGVKASESIVFANNVQAASATHQIWIAGRYYTITLAKNATPTNAGDALVAAITADVDAPVTAVNNVGTVTITAKHKGIYGNDIRLRVLTGDTGAGFQTVTATHDHLSNGTLSPSYATLITAIAPNKYDLIAVDDNAQASIEAWETHCNNNANEMEQRGQQAVFGGIEVDPHFTFSTFTTLAGLINAERVQIVFASTTEVMPLEIAAAMVARRASEDDPAMPLNGLVLGAVTVPPNGDMGLTRTEIEACLAAGVTPLEVVGTEMQIVRSITTYVKDAGSEPDTSLLDTTTITTLDYTRDACRVRVKARFRRAKLTARAPAAVRSVILGVLKELEGLDILKDIDAHAEDLAVEPNALDATRLDCAIPTPVVPGLHVVAARFDLYL